MATPASTFDYPDAQEHDYTLLSSDELPKELSRLASPRSIGSTDVVTLQPSSNPTDTSQDRHIVQDWIINSSRWRLQAVFDGHGGHETVDYAVEQVPLAIKNALVTLLDTGTSYDPVVVSQKLRDAIQMVDEGIAQALYDIFPGSPDILRGLSDEEIQAKINDGGSNSAAVLRCMRGTTALVSLFDTERRHLWVASLGDCQAVLGTKEPSGWASTVLSSNHNGSNAHEARRIQSEHPGEEEAIMNSRVLGAIAVTRALGDHEFKLPRLYTERVFLNSKPGFRLHSSVEAFTKRNFTPPYVTNIADVQHVVVPEDKEHYLILCSDGLTGLYESDDELDVRVLGDRWFNLLSRIEEDANRAMVILRDGLGGDNIEAVSQLLTLDCPTKWMDDVTVLVEKI